MAEINEENIETKGVQTVNRRRGEGMINDDEEMHRETEQEEDATIITQINTPWSESDLSHCLEI